MNYTFHSNFSVRLKAFIEQKNALGYPYLRSSIIIQNFDSFCFENYPQETKLTKEICLALERISHSDTCPYLSFRETSRSRPLSQG